MFRPLTRTKQQLSTEECIRILKSEPRGVLIENEISRFANNTAVLELTIEHMYGKLVNEA
ncbi:MAG: hypothetical protein E7397_06940 [Ruminococcaceae bacterium]|nr:hypothetical protein [Oscillospiraceae bacterium]